MPGRVLCRLSGEGCYFAAFLAVFFAAPALVVVFLAVDLAAAPRAVVAVLPVVAARLAVDCLVFAAFAAVVLLVAAFLAMLFAAPAFLAAALVVAYFAVPDAAPEAVPAEARWPTRPLLGSLLGAATYSLNCVPARNFGTEVLRIRTI